MGFTPPAGVDVCTDVKTNGRLPGLEIPRRIDLVLFAAEPLGPPGHTAT